MKKIKVFPTKRYKELGDLYGLFFEDINHAADGGLYAELVQNRSFEYCEIDHKEYHSLTAWEKGEGVSWQVLSDKPLNAENLHYLQVKSPAGGWICNKGYNTGVFTEAGKRYAFSLFVRGEKETTVRVLVAEDGPEAGVCAEGIVTMPACEEFVKREVELVCTHATTKGRLYLVFEDAGMYELDMVSLFPKDTFLGRENGLRRDIAQALAEMKPKFMRFPGGCLTHDGSLDDHARNSMYRWRRTLGKVEERPTWRNNWGYNQTLGLGYYEYFQFCEDIGAKPLPVLPGGFNPHKGEGVPIEELDVWVQEALDLIEFACGDSSTKWGSVRAEMGHVKPFGLEYLGIGNEEIGEGFFERYPYFHKAIKEKYPRIKVINTAGPFAVGEGYDDGWNSARYHGSDLVDEHYYSSPEWFLGNMHHYEDFDASGPKVFLGEYASWGNTYYNAIVEAAYMTHLERSKAVALACYAPMLCNVDYVNWKPDMLWFDNHRICKTPNYYVQKLFMENQGTHAVEFSLEGLDEVLPLTDETGIVGDIIIQGNDVKGKIWDVTLTADGECRELAAFDITDNSRHVLAQVEAEKYELSFKFRRSEGRKGLKIFFGSRDAGNEIQWEFGGWDNWDCNIMTLHNGRGSTISHRIFHVEDMDYELRLVIEGRHITTYVNGVCYNDVVDHLPQLEELYVTASVDEGNGDVILKAVNLTGEVKTVEVDLGAENETGATRELQIGTLSGCVLAAENSLDEPDVIAPYYETMQVDSGAFCYDFPPHSVTVMVQKNR